MRKSLDLASSSRPLQISSAFQRDSIPGTIYVEARYPEQARNACSGLVGVYLSRGINLVPVNEMAPLLTVKKPDLVTPGTWVRIRRGRYHNDLAQVVDITDNGATFTVRCVPRIDLTPCDDPAAASGRNHQKHATGGRHRQRLFHHAEVVKRYGPHAISKLGQIYVFRSDSYKDGCLLKTFQATALIFENVNPTLDEIAMFSSSDGELEDGTMDLSDIAQSSCNTSNALIEPGDRVEVLSGELVGVHGIVEEVDADILTLTTAGTDLKSQKFEISVRRVRKVFKLGDHVKVISGKNAGETGLVVGVNEDVVTFLGDMNMREFNIFSKDLKEADGLVSGVAPAGKYNLHDLVQLRQVRSIIFIFLSLANTLNSVQRLSVLLHRLNTTPFVFSTRMELYVLSMHAKLPCAETLVVLSRLTLKVSKYASTTT